MTTKIVSLWVVLLLAGALLAQTGPDSSSNSQPRLVSRPAIVGVAHIGLKTNDLAAALNDLPHLGDEAESFAEDMSEVVRSQPFLISNGGDPAAS